MTKDESLWVRVLSGKYLRQQDFWQIKAAGKSSWLWRSILQNREGLKDGMCYKVSNGQSISAARDPWVPTMDGFRPLLRDGLLLESNALKVSELLLEGGMRWDAVKIRNFFTQESAHAILQIRLPVTSSQDKFFWPKDPSGDFSMKTAHRNLVQKRGSPMSLIEKGDWRALWKLKIHERMKLLLWKVI